MDDMTVLYHQDTHTPNKKVKNNVFVSCDGAMEYDMMIYRNS